MLRSDLTGPHTVDTRRRKADMSASTRSNTTVVMENAQKNPGAAGVGQITDFIRLGDGLPIRYGTEVIDAISGGGAPGGHLDDQCAQAGIDKIKDRFSPAEQLVDRRKKAASIETARCQRKTHQSAGETALQSFALADEFVWYESFELGE